MKDGHSVRTRLQDIVSDCRLLKEEKTYIDHSKSTCLFVDNDRTLREDGVDADCVAMLTKSTSGDGVNRALCS